MMGMKVRRGTQIETLHSFDSVRMTLKLKSGITVIDKKREWEYHHPKYKKWFQCFTNQGNTP